MRRTHRILLGVIATGLVAAPSAQAAPTSPPAGEYAGKSAGVKATITVDSSGGGRARFSMKVSCGTVKGTVALTSRPAGSLKGKRSSARKATVIKVRAGRNIGELTGSIRYKGIEGRGEDRHVCKRKRAFGATLDPESSEAIKELSGHYSGAGAEGGLPIEFDVSYDHAAEALRVEDLNFESDTECWSDLDGDDETHSLLARIAGLAGQVDPDGYFEVDFTPDEDTEYYVEGMIEGGEADLYIEVSGFFALDGTPRAEGPLACESWGEDYSATKDGE